MRIIKFERLLSVASKFRVMRNKGDHCVMQGKLRSVFPDLSNEQSKIVAVTLCSFFLQDYPQITSVMLSDRDKFELYCKCRLKIPLTSPVSLDQKMLIQEFQFLMKSIYIPLLRSIRDYVPISPVTSWFFRGLTLPDKEAVETYIVKMEETNSLKSVKSFTRDITCALKFADPSSSIQNPLSIQLARMGLKSEKHTTGLVLACFEANMYLLVYNL